MSDDILACLGGQAVRTSPWPRWPRVTESTRRAVLDVLGSTRWAVSGAFDGRVSYERRFAEAFATFHGVPFCTPTASGTTALTIALQALGIGRGDEVLVPGLTWVACASAVWSVGAVPVLVDIDPATLTMSPEAAAAACTERTAAILVVHLFCQVADLDAFTDLANLRGIALIEDCAQAHGARWLARPVGTHGAVGCFSMQQSKLLTSGEGGAVITADERLYNRLEQLRCDGRRFSTEPSLGRLELLEVGDVQGRNFCLSEFQAAVLAEGLTRLEGQNATRTRNVNNLAAMLDQSEGVRIPPADRRVTTQTFYGLVLRFDLELFAGASIDAVARALSSELRTSINPIYEPLNRHPLLCPLNAPRGDMAQPEVDRLDPRRFDLPAAEDARRTCATITHPVLLDTEIGMAQVAEALAKVRRYAKLLCAVQPLVNRQAF